MKNITLIVAATIVMVHAAYSQSLTPQVISTSGAYFVSTTGYSLSETVGELALVETFAPTGGVNILTQGFQQPDMTTETSIENTINVSNSGNVSMYPNPAMNSVNLVFNFSDAGNATVTVYNLLGDIIRLPQRYGITPNASAPTMINTAPLPAGVYFVQVDFQSLVDGSHQLNNMKLTVIH